MASGILSAGREGLAGRLPERYGNLDDRIRGLLLDELRPGMSVLDVGAGRTPTLAAEQRPSDVRWAGLDISAAELAAAPPGSYDEVFESDIVRLRPELEGRYDVVVSFQVLEHVKPLDDAIANMRRYLKPGGVLLVQMSGALTIQAVVNRVVPHRAALWLLKRLTPSRQEASVFPAYYHHCWSRPLRRMFASWPQAEVEPLYLGAGYLHSRRYSLALVIMYEEWTRSRGHDALAPYYLVRAVA